MNGAPVRVSIGVGVDTLWLKKIFLQSLTRFETEHGRRGAARRGERSLRPSGSDEREPRLSPLTNIFVSKSRNLIRDLTRESTRLLHALRVSISISAGAEAKVTAFFQKLRKFGNIFAGFGESGGEAMVTPSGVPDK